MPETGIDATYEICGIVQHFRDGRVIGGGAGHLVMSPHDPCVRIAIQWIIGIAGAEVHQEQVAIARARIRSGSLGIEVPGIVTQIQDLRDLDAMLQDREAPRQFPGSVSVALAEVMSRDVLRLRICREGQPIAEIEVTRGDAEPMISELERLGSEASATPGDPKKGEERR